MSISLTHKYLTNNQFNFDRLLVQSRPLILLKPKRCPPPSMPGNYLLRRNSLFLRVEQTIASGKTSRDMHWSVTSHTGVNGFSDHSVLSFSHILF